MKNPANWNLLLLVLCGLFSAGNAREPLAGDLSETEKWEEFKKAPLLELEPIPARKPGTPPPQKELSREFIEKAEAEVREVARQLKAPEPGKLEWHPHHSWTSVYHRWNGKKVYIGAFLDPEEKEIRSYYFRGVPALAIVEERKTPDLREKFGAELHEKCFGVKPIGEYGKSGSWVMTVEGVPLARAAHLSTERGSNGVWTIQMHRGSTLAEAEKVREQLANRPAKLTAREALAIAWKNWKALRGESFGKLEFHSSTILRQVAREELAPWKSATFAGKAWRSAGDGDHDGEDRVYFAVRLDGGLHSVTALVDRVDGTIVSLTQEQLPW